MFVPLNVYDMVSTPQLFFDTFCRAGIMYGALLKWMIKVTKNDIIMIIFMLLFTITCFGMHIVSLLV